MSLDVFETQVALAVRDGDGTLAAIEDGVPMHDHIKRSRNPQGMHRNAVMAALNRMEAFGYLRIAAAKFRITPDGSKYLARNRVAQLVAKARA